MELLKIVENSFSYRECLIKLGWNITGTNYQKLKKELNNNNIDAVSIFKNKHKISVYKTSMDEILIENSLYSRSALKRRIIKEKLISYKCKFCNNEGFWNGKKISLILDHINGINNDNRIENLRFLCPNCNATLDTHCGKNIKNSHYGLEKKENRCKCGEIISDNSINCYKCSKIQQRTQERPSYEILIEEINKTNYTKVGLKYGVSDNTIRKWVRWYEKYERGS